mgnify:CR=1 FL=1
MGKGGEVQQPTTFGRATQSSKHARAEAESSAQKQSKMPMHISSKPRKASMPQILVAVHVAYK